MHFDQWVKKHYRWMMAVIVLFMAVPLVITFAPGNIGGGGGGGGIAGEFTVVRADGTRETIQVTERELAPYEEVSRTLTLLRAMLYDLSPENYGGKLYFDLDLQHGYTGLVRRITLNRELERGALQDSILQQLGDVHEVYKQVAWETLILNRIAEDQVPVVPEAEVDRVVRDLMEAWRLEDAGDNEAHRLALWAHAMFRATPKQLSFAVSAALRVSKFLSQNTADVFPSFSAVYSDRLDQSRQVRFRYSLVRANDPRLLQKLRPIRVEEIFKHYKQNRSTFQSPPIAQLLYVSAAFDEFAKRVPDPTEADLKAHFDADPRAFAAPDSQQLPKFEDVRARVADAVRKRRARDVANEVSWLLWNEVKAGIAQFKEKHQKDPDGKDAFRIAEAKIVELRALKGHDFKYLLTEYFTQKQAEQIKKDNALGDKAGIERFAFATDRKAGELSELVEETETGFHFYVMYRLMPSREVPLTRRLEELIRARLEKDELVRVAEVEAKAVAETAEKSGLHEAERRHRVGFTQSGYFEPYSGDPYSQPNIATGISDRSISESIFVLSAQLKNVGSAGVEMVGEAPVRGRPRGIRGYVVGVLDDAYYAPAKEISRDVSSERGRRIVSLRNLEKEKLRLSILKEAGLMKQPGSEPEAPPSGP